MPNNNKAASWQHIFNEIKEKITDEEILKWIKDLKTVSIEANTITLEAPNKYIKMWVEDHYLDYLKEIKQEEGLIELGVTIAYYNQSNNTDVIYTRITPIGADHLTIKKVNNNVEYVDNEELKVIYGIVEHVAEFPEVTNAENLKNKAINLFETINNASDIFEINVLDISYISANFKRFRISQKCRIKNNIFGTDEVRRIVSMTIPLDEPYKTTLNLSQNTNTMTSTTARLIQSVKNNNINNYNANTKISAIDSSVNKVNAKFEKQRKYSIMGV